MLGLKLVILLALPSEYRHVSAYLVDSYSLQATPPTGGRKMRENTQGWREDPAAGLEPGRLSI